MDSPWNSPGQNTGVGSLSISSGDLPNPGIEPRSPALQVATLPAEPQGKPKNTEVGSLSLLQGIFQTQKWNRGLLLCRRILYQLSYQEALRLLTKYLISKEKDMMWPKPLIMNHCLSCDQSLRPKKMLLHAGNSWKPEVTCSEQPRAKARTLFGLGESYITRQHFKCQVQTMPMDFTEVAISFILLNY